MAGKIGPSISCLAASLSSPSHNSRCFQMHKMGKLSSFFSFTIQLSFSRGLHESKHDSQPLRYAKVESFQSINWLLKSKWGFSSRNTALFATSEEQSPLNELISVASELEDRLPISEGIPSSTDIDLQFEGSGGRPGVISFYNLPYGEGNGTPMPRPRSNQNSLLWFIGPAVLVASFIFPSLYLRRILSTIFEDSLLTDFLILFFTEALFYCGVAVFLLLIDLLTRPPETNAMANTYRTFTPELGQRISSVATLVLSLIIPMVTMGLVWPWTGPAASATLAPYLVGIVVQFAFEQYVRHKKSPSWPVIPIIFQVYRLHQLNRAAQLVTALSFTVKGAEMTSHNLAINSSLGTLLNVLQCLGVLCIWSLSNFLMRVFASTPTTVQ